MKIRHRMDLRAKHTMEQSEARAEELSKAIKFAKLLSYKRISWQTLRNLGYNIERLGYRGKS